MYTPTKLREAAAVARALATRRDKRSPYLLNLATRLEDEATWREAVRAGLKPPPRMNIDPGPVIGARRKEEEVT
jgi:hypothetical protein